MTEQKKWYLNEIIFDIDFYKTYLRNHFDKTTRKIIDQDFEEEEKLGAYSIYINSSNAYYDELWFITYKPSNDTKCVLMTNINTSSPYACCMANMIRDDYANKEEEDDLCLHTEEQILNLCDNTTNQQEMVKSLINNGGVINNDRCLFINKFINAKKENNADDGDKDN